MLRLRSQLLTAIRSFFVQQDFIEVETPVRLPAPALERYINAIPAGDWYLRTSPELHMKRLLVDGVSPIFQMGPCFRAGEHGNRHRTEFTMLEWYRLNADYRDILADTEALIRHVASSLRADGNSGLNGVDVDAPWERIRVSEAFLKHAGWDPVAAFDAGRFDLDMVNLVEPSLARDRGVVLIDYPIEVAALAKRSSSNPRVAERWELYLGGLEIANAFSELTDAREQRLRFETCALERAQDGDEVYPLDRAFLAALEKGLPPCGGIALGVDRLLMALTGIDDIGKVMAFGHESANSVDTAL
jgi:lysyl-tRNA synthetase class 2